MSCSGECIGYSTKTASRRGECPKDCIKNILIQLQAAAEKEARENANDKCFGDDCECKAESIEVIGSGCETHRLGDPCGDICVYHVTVVYKGVCKSKP